MGTSKTEETEKETHILEELPPMKKAIKQGLSVKIRF